MKVIVGDCEVFKHYFLFVVKDMATGDMDIIETRDDLLDFYNKNKNSIWVFYNASYDTNILKAVMLGTYNPHTVSQKIIEHNKKPFEIFDRNDLYRFPMITFDAKTTVHGLKKLEAFMGEDIRETTVPFDLPRPLTDQEREEVIFYCKHDVEQTCKVLRHIKPAFASHLAICKEFGLSRLDNLHKKTPRLAEAVLMGNTKRKPSKDDEFNVTIPECIQLTKYQFVQDWFKEMLERGRNGEDVYSQKLECEVHGVPHVFAWGGVHGARPRFECMGDIIALDVNSYYPSMIINFGFYSRNWPNAAYYNDIYNTRLELKKAKDPRQQAYKLILNSSYGLLKDKYSRSYDPRMANSVCITGQLLLLMLMERIELSGCDVELIQSNSDGVYYTAPYFYQREFKEVYQQWERDTGMVLECDYYKHIVQKDVNNYLMVAKNGHYKTKGSMLKNRSPLDNDMPIIQKALLQYFMNNTSPEETINSSNMLIDFQIVKSRPSCYDTMELNGESYDLKYYRLFAAKGDEYGSPRWRRGDKLAKVGGAPEVCKLDNSNINDVTCPHWLDKEWYINRVKELIYDPSSGFNITQHLGV